MSRLTLEPHQSERFSIHWLSLVLSIKKSDLVVSVFGFLLNSFTIPSNLALNDTVST